MHAPHFRDPKNRTDQQAAPCVLPRSSFNDADAPVILRRAQEGRQLSRVRYRDAAFALTSIGVEARTTEDMLYRASIIAQATLSAHLLGAGFDDQWCAKYIRHNIKRRSPMPTPAVAPANAAKQRLAETLSPYWKWNRVAIWHRVRPDDGGFALDEVTILPLALLDQVRAVTGRNFCFSVRFRM